MEYSSMHARAQRDFDVNLPVKMPKMCLASLDPLGCAYQEVYSQLGTDPRARHLD